MSYVCANMHFEVRSSLALKSPLLISRTLGSVPFLSVPRSYCAIPVGCVLATFVSQ